jgi:DNA replication regulator DPB11
LTKQITHLISFRTEGAKYKAAKSWGLRIVSIEWLRDSLERGMILDEKLYDPALPAEERGKDAWDKTKPKRTSLGKRSRDDSTTGLEGGKRKLRRTASTKLSTQNDGLWGDIVGGGAVAQVSRSGQWETDDTDALPGDKNAQPENAKVNTKSGLLQSTIENPSRKIGMFNTCRFYLHDFPPPHRQILHEHVVFNDGEISKSIEDLVSPEKSPQSRLFRIVSHDLPVSELPPLPESQLPVQTITVWWLERCLHRKEFMDPAKHIIGRPFPIFPIEGFSELTVSTSAFSGIDLLHVTKAVRLIGAKYSEDMTPGSSILITKSSTAVRKDKFDHAQEWRVPIVTADWLWDSIKAGTKLSWSKYRIRSQQRSDSAPNTNEKILTKALPRLDRSKSELGKPASSISSRTSKSSTRPPKNSRLDNIAFTSDETVVKEEHNTLPNGSLADTSNTATQEQSYKSEPLSERSINSPTRTVSTAPATSDHPSFRPQEDMSSAISNLLAKTKTAAVNPAQNEASEGRKRGANRILGRVTSNISTGSTCRSRATSVDSTATNGHPVEYPTYHLGNPGSDQTANEKIELLMHGGGHVEKDVDSQPPSTQLQYEDPDSTEAREMVMARMMGEKVQPKKGMKEKAVTVGDFMDKSRSNQRTRRERGNLK